MQEPQIPLYVESIRELIPHRYPFLLVDRVVEFVDGERIRGIKNVTANEEFFQGHFPQRPMMPGVLMLEALAQLGVLFSRMGTNAAPRDRLNVFAGVDEVRFRRPVVPGDVLELEMTLIKRRAGLWKMKGVARVENDVAVEGILTAAEARA